MSESIEQIREKAVALVDRIKTDAEFKAQVEQHPEETLIAAGLPANVVSEFLAETQVGASEVNGYVVPFCGFTCLISFNK